MFENGIHLKPQTTEGWLELAARTQVSWLPLKKKKKSTFFIGFKQDLEYCYIIFTIVRTQFKITWHTETAPHKT